LYGKANGRAARAGLDYSHIDFAVCTSRRILVSNVPTASADAIADLSLWLLLGALRGLTGGNKQDHGDASAALGHDPRGKVLGIVGATPVARRLAVRANAALGMSVVYHTMERLDKEHEKDFGPGVKYAERLEDLFRQSDAISLHISAGVRSVTLTVENEMGLANLNASLRRIILYQHHSLSSSGHPPFSSILRHPISSTNLH
jgi:lactate dehydrogenase-like 2-hydroxyacid dehydrogenase